MANEPWNKTCIPFPSAVSSSRIPFTDSTDTLIESLLTGCEKVLTLLCSEVLQTEIRVLYELLYVLNNGFRQHKPFRVLKQVRYRLNELYTVFHVMVLRICVSLCRDAGAEIGECDVPSQPMLEWLCLKLLGASSLLARTLERCTQAFMLTRQHLLLSEFVVLNVVITSMLSRLCTKPVISSTGVFVAIDNNTLCGSKRSFFSFMPKLFYVKIVFHEDVFIIEMQSLVNFDTFFPKMSLETEMKTDISSQAAVFQKRKFLKLLRKVSSFRNMAAHLKEMMRWCRSCKFNQERKHLAFLHLRCLRMESLEDEGVRVEKRLKRFKLKVQKALLLQNTLPQKHSISFIALGRTRWHHGSFMARYRTARRRAALSRKCSRPVKDFFVSLKHRPQQQSSKEEVSGNNKVPGAEEKMDSQTALQKPNVLNDDIDDIFASLGF
uniref:Nucleolus and neural progenitor protein n=1 Tax=Cyprinus carpio TaxID=7962 RepID=A0A8C2D9T5_CYPCA